MTAGIIRKPFGSTMNACALAQAIVDSVREPILVLDQGLRVIVASRSFHTDFRVSPEDTQGRLLDALGDGEWDVPGLRLLLQEVLANHIVVEGFEVERDFPGLGARVMRLNARQMPYREGGGATILLGIQDVTEQRAGEHKMEEVLRQKDTSLHELRHRVANSLQIVASIILMKARAVNSEETRRDLQDAHKRVLSIATVQEQLHVSGAGGRIEMVPYLSKLCATLADSMIGDGRSVTMNVTGNGGCMASRPAESLGLIAVELVMNALKHAFLSDSIERDITISYDASEADWTLCVADNGVGRMVDARAHPKAALGTGIIKALAQQLDARVTTSSGPQGTVVSVSHVAFAAANVTRVA